MELAIPGSPGWVILGTLCRCHGLNAALEADLAALLRGFPRPAPGIGWQDTVELVLEPGDGPVPVLCGPDGARWELGSGGATAAIAPPIEYQLVSEALARARDRWIFHAGAVEGPRGTCLVVGESGAGKTSLTLWLWASGLRLVTDDLCPFPRGATSPERFARALHMDGEYSPRLLARIPPRPPGYPADYYPFPDPAAGTPRPVSDVLVLERGSRTSQSEVEIEPLIQSDAVHHLLGAAIRTPYFDYTGALADLLALVPRCRVHRLRASTPEEAGEAALGLLLSA
ncbi:MAG: HPr Serine kinase C-terminal domain [Acidobacteriota bacterium]|jgi:hypothetical protein|nr:HPr Serine kinase C-terminal domain [Acidobacteriota bacterium]